MVGGCIGGWVHWWVGALVDGCNACLVLLVLMVAKLHESNVWLCKVLGATAALKTLMDTHTHTHSKVYIFS